MSKVIEELNQLLSDSKVFEQNLYNYHWNIRCKHFLSYHEKLGELYEMVGGDIDEFAERILQLGGTPISKMSEYLEKSGVEEEDVVHDAEKIWELVLRDLYKTVDALNKCRKAAVSNDDEGTNTMIGDKLLCVQKQVWMVSSILMVDVIADKSEKVEEKSGGGTLASTSKPRRIFKRP